MIHEEDSNSQEDQAIGFSWLASAPSGGLVEGEVENTSYEWDNYRENPSFVDPDKDPGLPEEEEVLLQLQSTPKVFGRFSSTDEQFLD